MKRVQCKAFARSTGAQCQAKAVPGKEVCRVHGGASEGAPKENQNAKKHGIYGKHFTDHERETLPDLESRIGTLTDEITLCRVRINRALAAENSAFELDPNGLEIVKFVDKAATEFAAGPEHVHERIDYGAHVERLLRRLESLEKTRAELIKLGRENPEVDDAPVTEIAVHVVTAENVHLYRDGGDDDEEA
jgi:hypothetical protein